PTGPSKIRSGVWTHWYSVPERLTPSSRTGRQAASTRPWPSTLTDGTAAGRQTGATGRDGPPGTIEQAATSSAADSADRAAAPTRPAAAVTRSAPAASP